MLVELTMGNGFRWIPDLFWHSLVDNGHKVISVTYSAMKYKPSLTSKSPGLPYTVPSNESKLSDRYREGL